MDLTKFRWWAGHALVDRETWATYTGTPNAYTGAAENLEKVTEEALLSPDYRREHRMMLPSGIKDIHGVEIYEGDILEVFIDRTIRFTKSLMAFVECLPEQGFVVQCAHPFPLKRGLDCAIEGNLYEKPEWLVNFDNSGDLAKRWK